MPQEPQSSPVRVLCASPTGPRLDWMRGALEGAGFDVLVAADSLEAVASMAKDLPDLALVACDLAPGGVQLCEELSLAAADGDLPLVLSYESLVPGLVEKARAVGVADFVGEGESPEVLVHRVKRALQHARMVRTVRGSLSRALEDAGMSTSATHGSHLAGPSPTVLTSRATFIDRLSGVLPRAQGEAKHVAVLALSLWTGDEDESGPRSADTEEAFCLGVVELLRKVVADYEETGSVSHPRGSVRIAPLAWDRYALFVPELMRVQDASRLSSRIQDAVSKTMYFEGRALDLTGSLGIAIYPSDSDQPGELLERAETATEYARQEGCARVWFYTESMNRWAVERLTLEQNLREAIENEELRVFYQPRVRVSDRTVIGMEALVRWEHPTLGLISPAQFIPLAEESGLIVPIGEWVLREACRQSVEWQDRGLPPVRISVNLSAVQFRKSNLYETVVSTLSDTGLGHQWLELELTESMLMRDPKSTIATLEKLKSAGIHLSIDDFGTGYSSLSYLKRFPIDALKIDRSFVSELTTNPEDAAIATTIILMGHSLRLEVVAEGVETESQLSFLQVLQCNEAQGFLFSPPVPAVKAEAFLGKTFALEDASIVPVEAS